MTTDLTKDKGTGTYRVMVLPEKKGTWVRRGALYTRRSDADACRADYASVYHDAVVEEVTHYEIMVELGLGIVTPEPDCKLLTEGVTGV